MKVKISIIFVYFNTPEEILSSISSIPSAVGRMSYEIIIIDNNSSIPLSTGDLKETKVRIVRNKKNVGYGAALNIGAKLSKGDYLLSTNTDTVYSKDSLKKMLEVMEKDGKIGIIGPKLVDENGNTLQTRSKLPLFPLNIVIYSGLKKVPFIRGIRDWFHYTKSEKNVEVVGGASMLVRKEAFDKVGGFDPRFFLFFEEADICKRIKEVGYKVRYLSEAKVTHSVGRSLTDKTLIQEYFENSRFRFIRKHQGILPAMLSEAFIKFFSLTTFSLLTIFTLSLYLNLYKISTLMMFYGDFARDMLVARDMVINGEIPLLGIPSSVVWLHQGPLSIYMIGISFLLGGFYAWIPAIFYAILGSLTTILVYVLGKNLFNFRVGIISAAIFATSPLVIVNARIPYHTAPIPFFVAVFFIFFYKFLKLKTVNYLILTGLFLGILFQLELSNGLLILVFIILSFVNKVKFSAKRAILFFTSFCIGILPILIYDISHRFVQTLGFAAWVANRTRLFFGLTFSEETTSGNLPSALALIRDQTVRFVFPPHFLVAYALILAAIVFLSIKVIMNRKRLEVNLQLISIGLIIPLLGFVVHSQPGTAYFPVLFPLLAVLIGYLFSDLVLRWRVFYAVMIMIFVANMLFILSNSYFLNINGKGGTEIKYWNYGLGVSYGEQERLITFIKKDAKNQPVLLMPGGFLTKFKTSIDNYHYIAWQKGIKESADGIRYLIYQDFKDIPRDSKIFFRTENLTLVKDE